MRFILSIALLACASITSAASLTVIIADPANQEGTIRIALFNSPEGFPETEYLVKSIEVSASSVDSDAKVTTIFKNLSPGTYAISTYHDANDNEVLDKNSFGIPKEPYGFGNNAEGDFGPAKFEDASFVVTEEGENIQEIKLH